MSLKNSRRFSLENKWVLITGASSGFGAAAATAFGAVGAKLLLGARRVDRLKQVAAAAKKSGAAAAHFHKLDVSKTSSVNIFMAWAEEKIGNRKSEIGKLHVLINNAGGAHGLDTVADRQRRGLGNHVADECARRDARHARGAAAAAAR